MTIYLDMDGVIADFFGGLEVKYGVDHWKSVQDREIKFKEFLSRYISSSVKVKYIYGIENNIKFFELLKSVDIFLLPYSKKTYKYSGSGFITDAIFLEKPLIVSQGISMRNLLTFNNAISANSPEEYSTAIIKISKNYANYSKNSKLAKKNLKKNNSRIF